MKKEENSIKYKFSDFTWSEYRSLIQLAKQSHVFRGFNDFDSDENFILWRHDIDFSVSKALEMAKIEAEESVVATYFVWLHSEYYNVFEKEVTDAIKEIISCGHKVGVHFDCDYYGVSSVQELEIYLSKEKALLEDIFDIQIDTFSFHNPGINFGEMSSWKYADMINTYADYFKENVGYCSDSNGIWRFKSIRETIEEQSDKPLQILTHPVWWTDTPTSPRERMWSNIEVRAGKNKELYNEIIRVGGRETIDWT